MSANGLSSEQKHKLQKNHLECEPKTLKTYIFPNVLILLLFSEVKANIFFLLKFSRNTICVDSDVLNSVAKSTVLRRMFCLDRLSSVSRSHQVIAFDQNLHISYVMKSGPQHQCVPDTLNKAIVSKSNRIPFREDKSDT